MNATSSTVNTPPVIDDALCAHLREQARRIRELTIRMIGRSGSGHPGPALSIADALAVLYHHVMRVDPHNPHWPERDRFVLSKGHGCASLYVTLADRGYFPIDWLWTFRQAGSVLSGHPSMKDNPGVDMTTGSLGQGLSAANGMALAARLDGLAYRVYCILGDGECQEGQVWEAALTASHRKLDNVTALLDANGLQIDGPTARIKNVEPLDAKWRAFGWNVITVDGHDVDQIASALAAARAHRGQPTLVLMHTVKGKGVSYMEGQVDWHGKAPDADETRRALAELGAADHG